MAVDLVGFPVGNIVDGMLSYVQHLFSTPDITPPSVRWNSDSRKSKIRISGAFATDDERAESVPYISIDRGPFSFANRTIDNLQSATANTMDRTDHIDWLDGHVNLVCGSSVASEASSLANFLAICIQSDRHSMKGVLKFIRHLNYLDIGPELPIKMDNEPCIWEVNLRIKASVYVGWINEAKTPEAIFERALIQTEDGKSTYEGGSLITTTGSSSVVDLNANFGTDNNNLPQLLEQELNAGWYSVVFNNGSKYRIESVLSNTSLKLLQFNSDNEVVDFNPTSDDIRDYKIVWNSIRLKVEIPNKTS